MPSIKNPRLKAKYGCIQVRRKLLRSLCWILEAIDSELLESLIFSAYTCGEITEGRAMNLLGCERLTFRRKSNDWGDRKQPR